MKRDPIKRYSQVAQMDSWFDYEHPEGNWVRFTDHQAALAEAISLAKIFKNYSRHKAWPMHMDTCYCGYDELLIDFDNFLSSGDENKTP